MAPFLDRIGRHKHVYASISRIIAYYFEATTVLVAGQYRLTPRNLNDHTITST